MYGWVLITRLLKGTTQIEIGAYKISKTFILQSYYFGFNSDVILLKESEKGIKDL